MIFPIPNWFPLCAFNAQLLQLHVALWLTDLAYCKEILLDMWVNIYVL